MSSLHQIMQLQRKTPFKTAIVVRQENDASKGEFTNNGVVGIISQGEEPLISAYSQESLNDKLLWHLPLNQYQQELEIKVRQQSQWVRVVNALKGGANILSTSSNATVAIWVYDQQTIAKNELELKKCS